MEKIKEKKINFLERNYKIFIVSLSENSNEPVINFFINNDIEVSNDISVNGTVFAGNPIFCPDVFINHINDKNKFIYVNSNIDNWVDEVLSNKLKENKHIVNFMNDYSMVGLEKTFIKHQRDVIKYIPQNNLLFLDESDDSQIILDFINYRNYGNV